MSLPDDRHPSQDSVAPSGNTFLHYSEKEGKLPNRVIEATLPHQECTGPHAPSTPSTTLAAKAPEMAPDLITTILLDNDDAEFSESLLTYVKTADASGDHRDPLDDARVLTRLCALTDTLFLHTLHGLAEPTHAGQVVLFLEPVMARIAALPYHRYQGEFLPRVKGLPGFDVHHYRRELRPYLLCHSAQQGCRQTFAPMTAAALYAMDIPDLEFIA